jgi:hypothetical protein
MAFGESSVDDAVALVPIAIVPFPKAFESSPTEIAVIFEASAMLPIAMAPSSTVVAEAPMATELPPPANASQPRFTSLPPVFHSPGLTVASQ